MGRGLPQLQELYPSITSTKFQRAYIWREDSDLLLEDRMVMSQIAEELHSRGYRYRSGHPFIEIKPKGQRFAVTNKSRIAQLLLCSCYKPICYVPPYSRPSMIRKKPNRTAAPFTILGIQTCDQTRMAAIPRANRS